MLASQDVRVEETYVELPYVSRDGNVKYERSHCDACPCGGKMAGEKGIRVTTTFINKSFDRNKPSWKIYERKFECNIGVACYWPIELAKQDKGIVTVLETD